MAQSTTQSFAGASSYTTKPNVGYIMPHASGLIAHGAMMTTDINGNSMANAAAIKRLGRNFAPGAADAALVGTPTPAGAYASFSHTAYIDTLVKETKSMSLLALFRTGATLSGTDLAPVLGNYITAATGSLQLYYQSGATSPAGNLRAQAAYTQAAAATFTGSVADGQMIVGTLSSGTIVTGAHLLTGTGLTADTTVTGQISGTTGGVGVYSLSRSDQTVAAGTTITTGAIQTGGVNVVIPNASLWTLACLRVTDGVGMTLDVLTTGSTVARGVYTIANPRAFPSGDNTMTAFGSRSTAIQGACDGIAYNIANRVWTDAEMNDNANQLRAYATNRSLAA